jgi:hypothetical protein
MREYAYEIWSGDKRLGVAKDDDPLVALQEALKAVESLEEYEIIEVTRKKVASNGSMD